MSALEIAGFHSRVRLIYEGTDLLNHSHLILT
jgi:hypothetical protein